MSGPAQTAGAPVKLFLGGIERSGTTVLAAALARWLNGVAIPEAQFKKFLLTPDVGAEALRYVRQSMRFRLWDLPPQDYGTGTGAETFDRIVAHILAEHALPDPAFIIDHTPENCGYGEDLLSVFPDACLIHITRDPRAVICSLMRTDWGVPSLGDALSFWRRRDALAERALVLAATAGASRVATVSYEDLCDGPGDTLTRLCRDLGLVPSPAAVAHRATLLPRYTRSQHQRVADLPRNDFQWRDSLSSADIQRIEAELADTSLGHLYGFAAGPKEGVLPRAPFPARLGQWLRARRRRRRRGVERIDLPPLPGTGACP